MLLKHPVPQWPHLPRCQPSNGHGIVAVEEVGIREGGREGGRKQEKGGRKVVAELRALFGPKGGGGMAWTQHGAAGLGWHTGACARGGVGGLVTSPCPMGPSIQPVLLTPAAARRPGARGATHRACRGSRGAQRPAAPAPGAWGGAAGCSGWSAPAPHPGPHTRSAWGF